MTAVSLVNSPVKFLALLILNLCLMLNFSLVESLAASALSPRHSGLEMPGTRNKGNIPSGKISSNANPGTHGYVDAYGRPLRPAEAEKKVSKQTLPRGAYGLQERANVQQKTMDTVKQLPNPDSGKPAWNF